MTTPERITRADVTYLYHLAYWDGPLSGACLWRGERFRFECVADELVPTGGRDEDGDPEYDSVRTFHLVRLTPEEWAAEDERHALFREHVGTHTDYDPVTQRRAVGAVKPEAEWAKFYDRYPPRQIDTITREPVAVYKN